MSATDDTTAVAALVAGASPDAAPGATIETQDLRSALAAALDGLAAAAAQINALNAVLQSMTNGIAPIVAAHLRSDGVAVYQELQVFVGKRVKVVADAGAGVGRLQ